MNKNLAARLTKLESAKPARPDGKRLWRQLERACRDRPAEEYDPTINRIIQCWTTPELVAAEEYLSGLVEAGETDPL